MTEKEREELVEWLFWAFEGLVAESLWDDAVTARSKGNVFDWKSPAAK